MVLSMMTGPFLLGLMSAQAIAEGFAQIGLASEEFFRGERLPVLQPPPHEAAADADIVDS